MSLLRPFSACDLFSFNPINLDAWTETYAVSYYQNYLATWGDLFTVVESAGGKGKGRVGGGAGEGGGLMGYVMGKTEGYGDLWHGHVSAITVSPGHRRLGLASMMMSLLEQVSQRDDAYFVDLFARVSNDLAIGLYESLGYRVFRTVEDYYGGGPKEPDENAYDMRKPLPRDKEGKSLQLPPGKRDGRDVLVQPHEVYFGSP